MNTNLIEIRKRKGDANQWRDVGALKQQTGLQEISQRQQLYNLHLPMLTT